MNRKTILFALAPLVLASCTVTPSTPATTEASIDSSVSASSQPVSFRERTLGFYSFLNALDPEKQAALVDPVTAKEVTYQKDIAFLTHPSYANILYIDFKTYCSLFAGALSKEVTATFDEQHNVYTVKDKDGKTIYVAGIDPEHNDIYYAGSLSSALGSSQTSAVSEAGAALMADLDLGQTELAQAKDPYIHCNYSVYTKDLPVYLENNKFIAPLGMFDSALGPGTGSYHFFDTTRVFQYNTPMLLGFPIGAADTSPLTVTQAYYQKNGMPYDLRLLDKASLYLTMENYYGLRRQRHIESMAEYFDALGFGESLLVDDANQRCYNYYDLMASLNDDHTGLSNIAVYWGDSGAQGHRGPVSNYRASITSTLKAERQEAFGMTSTAAGFGPEVKYSTSGETAYVYFDSFTFAMSGYDKDNRDAVWESDSYFYFLHQFKEIQKHGGVKRVIIDDACNGGGTLGIAMKLLALVSKTNSAEVYQYNLNTGAITGLTARIDSNQDGKYDADDVYGDDFEISILTSQGSFSCGNLFPIYAQQQSGVKILGKPSGGGECVVGSTYLPSGRGVQHSSTSILGRRVGDNLVMNVEDGAQPDIDLSYHEFYNLDLLEQKLTAPLVDAE